VFRGILFFAGNSNVLAFVASKGSTKGVSVEEVRGVGIFLNAGEVVLKVTVGVGETVSEVDLVLIAFKFMCKSECVVIPSKAKIFSFVVILEIRDFLAYSMPSQILRLLLILRER
jgi:hypothetical protein